jgi:hypothetical protein
MIVIYKYRITTHAETFKIAGFIRMLSVANQKEEVVVYAECDDTIEETTDVVVSRRLTGSLFEPHSEDKFIGTVNIMNGTLMFHIYYRLR